MKYATLLALTASASATQLDLFNMDNFMTAEAVKELMKATSESATKILKNELETVSATKVQWSQCDDDKGIFTMDDSTAAVPDPLVKGQSVSLNLVGALDEGVDVDHIHVQAKWNGVSLYTHDDPLGKHFDDTITYSFSWDVPSYAPGGKYDVTLTGIEKDSSKMFCVNAKFTF